MGVMAAVEWAAKLCYNGAMKTRIDTSLNNISISVPPIKNPVGWECPRCHAIHAPHVSRCNCPVPTQNRNSFQIVWVPNEPSTAGQLTDGTSLADEFEAWDIMSDEALSLVSSLQLCPVPGCGGIITDGECTRCNDDK